MSLTLQFPPKQKQWHPGIAHTTGKPQKFTFSTQNQIDEWKALYIRAIDFLEAMDIDNESEDNTKNYGSSLE